MPNNTCELIHALPPSSRRCFDRREAASYVGVSVGYFDKLVQTGTMPAPLPYPGVRRWDKRSLDHAVNILSGISANDDIREDQSNAEPVSPLMEWRSKKRAS